MLTEGSVKGDGLDGVHSQSLETDDAGVFGPVPDGSEARV